MRPERNPMIRLAMILSISTAAALAGVIMGNRNVAPPIAAPLLDFQDNGAPIIMVPERWPRCEPWMYFNSQGFEERCA